MDYDLYLEYDADIDLNVNNDIRKTSDEIFATILHETDEAVENAGNNVPERTKIGFIHLFRYNQVLAKTYGVNMSHNPLATMRIGSKALMELDYSLITQETIDEVGTVSNPNIVVLAHFGISAAFRNKGIGEQMLKGVMKQMNDILAVTNCSHEKAIELINDIGIKEKYSSNWRIRTSVLCDHLDIDEMFVQVFLASLYPEEQALLPKKILPALTREQIEAQKPGLVWDKIKQLQAGFYENSKTLAIRDQIYVEENPRGEPMYKRIKWVQMVIRAFEVAQIYRCPIKTAQKMLREVKEDDREHYPGMKERRYVSIKRFCEVHGDDEADLRKHLAELHGETDDDDDD